ncbi:MAG: RNA methyltransferase, partial [Rhodosalinus sp.]
LNLAQCVLLTAYEWRRQTAEVAHETIAAGPDGLAEAGEVERLADHYEERLDEAGFFFPEHKAGSMRRTLRNLWSRMPLTKADVRIFHGVLRQLVRHRDRTP